MFSYPEANATGPPTPSFLDTFLETYVAVTSNTFQLGAKLEVYAASGKFNVYGYLYFDALFQFNPFYFIADIGAMLALRMGSSSIASIQLLMTLEGTTPWKANGTAKLKLFWCLTVKVKFSKTFGERRDTLLADFPVLPLIEAALSNFGNWQAHLASGTSPLVSLKELPTFGDTIVVHPGGILEISQKIVPFNLRIDKVGNRKPSDGNRFEISHLRIESEDQDTAATKELFAPAQFLEKSDAEKLSSKSFEKFDSGVRVTASEALFADYYAKRDVEYELFYKDSQRDSLLSPFHILVAPDAPSFDSWAVKGAVASSELSFANNGQSALAPQAVSFVQEPFAVVNTWDLTVFDEHSLLNSESAALTRLSELIDENPALAGTLQVVPQFEVNEG